MNHQANATVLDDDVFPIVGWAGLSGDRITPETMRDMRKAGFTVNHGNLNGRDPALFGVFRGADGLLNLLVVSKNPCAWSMLNLKPSRPEPIFEFDVRDGSWAKPYPRRPENQPLTLAPGEGRLLRFGGEGQSRF